MPLVVELTNTLTTIVGTEQTIFNVTTSGTRILRCDLGPMIAADTIEIRAKSWILAGGTVREQQNWTYANQVGSPLFESIPFTWDVGGMFTIRQTTGAARQIIWKVILI